MEIKQTAIAGTLESSDAQVTVDLQLYRSYLTSYNGIFALYQGRVNIATAHLWDGELDEYNVSYVKKMMPGIPALIIRTGKRRQGFYVQKGNPKAGFSRSG